MGLAGPKRRTKIGHDPNNTTWARDDSTYGSKILRSHGWTPGDYLGAQNAAHASHLTAASASHIRVALREDNLGLGAKRGADPTQNFGLSGFQSLLGRLNGKSEVQLASEERVGKMLRLSEKYRMMGFVKGGYLLGESVEDEAIPSSEDAGEPKDALVDGEKKREKKRRRETDAESSAEQQVKQTKKKRRKDREEAETRTEEDDDDAEPRLSENVVKSGKKKKVDEDKLDKKKVGKSSESKEAKRQRKLEKRARKEARRLKKSSSTTPVDSELDRAAPMQTSSESNDEAWKRGSGSRHAIRQRYIRQKRMSGMDPQALREILMIKS